MDILGILIASVLMNGCAKKEVPVVPSLTITTLSPTPWIKGGDSPFTLEWTSTGSISFIDVVLKRTGGEDVTLVTGFANNGSYSISEDIVDKWTIATGYSLIVKETGNESVTATSGKFEVAAPSLTITTLSPTPWIKGGDSPFTLEWTSTGSISLIDIFLKPRDDEDFDDETMAFETIDNGSFSISKDIVEKWPIDTDYTLLVLGDGGMVFDISDKFEVAEV